MTTEERIKHIVFKHLNSDAFKVYLFGSRADGTAKKWSDYDIGLLGTGPVPEKILSAIEEDLENSDIPLVVEVVDLYSVTPNFRQVALQDAKLWTH